ncbi:MAG: hypothetical protein WAK26_09640 [Terracidiphilus sp.]
MFKVKLVVASLGIAMMLPASSALLAQAPAAPLPSQILTAKRVFISNAGGALDPKLWSGGPAQPYNELYAAIRSSGQYQLVAAPADADLIIEISFADPLTNVSGTKESGAVSSSTPQLNLVLRDLKTSIVLWTLNEKTSTSHMQKGRDQALADTIHQLVGDLKALTSQPAAPNVAK